MEVHSRKDNAYAAGHPNMKHSAAKNKHVPTSPKILFPQETENISNSSVPSIAKNQKTSLHLSVSSSVGEDPRTGAWIAVIGYEGVVRNNRMNSNEWVVTKAGGCLRDSESSHVESIFEWNRKTRFIADCTGSPDTISTGRIAVNTRTHRLRRYKHLYISTTSQ